MFDEDENGFAILHEPSNCDRRPATASKGNNTGHFIAGLWPGRVFFYESIGEKNHGLCLNEHPLTKMMREQVAFTWQNRRGQWVRHFFDIFVEQTDGRRIAYSVKPEARLTNKFMAEIVRIAEQVKETGFADDVRLLTDADLDPVELENAKLTYAMRVPDAEADAAAVDVLADMTGVQTLGDLTNRVALGARGYRALIRLIRTGKLRAIRHERITHITEVFKTGVSK